METLVALGHGFAVALMPYNLLWAALGVTVGTTVGVLPGIGPALTVALLLPVTYGGVLQGYTRLSQAKSSQLEFLVGLDVVFQPRSIERSVSAHQRLGEVEV